MPNLDEIKARLEKINGALWSSETYNNCITLKRRKEHDTEETIF